MDGPHSRPEPVGWQQGLAQLAREREAHFRRLAEELEKQ